MILYSYKKKVCKPSLCNFGGLGSWKSTSKWKTSTGYLFSIYKPATCGLKLSILLYLRPIIGRREIGLYPVQLGTFERINFTSPGKFTFKSLKDALKVPKILHAKSVWPWSRCVCLADIADRILSCVGFWMEDMRSYMITYDEEDAVSRYRCWVSGFGN